MTTDPDDLLIETLSFEKERKEEHKHQLSEKVHKIESSYLDFIMNGKIQANGDSKRQLLQLLQTTKEKKLD